jgi:hypothetical protein
MMSLRLGLIGAFALAVIVAVAAMDMTRPAAAQGGAVCAYGSASYRGVLQAILCPPSADGGTSAGGRHRRLHE